MIAQPLSATTQVDVNADEARQSPLFVLRGPQYTLETRGCIAHLPSGNTTTLGQRVKDFFANAQDGPKVLVGALPFDPHALDALYQPAALSLPTALQVSGGAKLPALIGQSQAEPAPNYYGDMVARCVAAISSKFSTSKLSTRKQAADQEAHLGKAVLARSLLLQAEHTINPLVLAKRLERDNSVTTYVLPLPQAIDEAPAWLVGASPELLISVRGRTVKSHPLAGSARRLADPHADAKAAAALSASSKDLDEHKFVVDAIVAALAPLCSELDAPSRPSLYTTDTMWHLGTEIVGTLKDDDISAASLAGLLHPTPAVCGTPRQLALDTIHQLEPVDRGFYAGAVGWVDDKGDGDWYVAIRCAHVQADRLRLFAGAGIVADSVPELEVAETAAKFRALLDALGVDDTHLHALSK
ncbi:isochorismate synthase [Oceanisphaera avium]|uniref:isochorismate synthase n=1 Tax=Oceanisphaera avium TaxID=1903694 RepID=A0A1Y0CWE6_9GAMM|nr:isochorismate synthase [Oceanisphaera avium]ART79673.1 isochorismate synthase [Oceanisphaera avium]